MTPYSDLPKECFWRTGVAEIVPNPFPNLWTPKYNISPDNGILTVGSCFAQHLGWALKDAGFDWRMAEPLPPGLDPELARDFHYGYFSFRTGNVYTASVLESWLTWAVDPSSQDREVWHDGDAFYDPMRPQVEPGGFETEEELFGARNMTLTSMLNGIKSSSIFVFTLGLTESWRNKSSGLTYATCPGTIAGKFDPAQHEFHNLKYPEIMEQMRRSRDLLKQINPGIRMLLTVSPVPLTASAVADRHILPSTVHSKSVLRAVAGDFADEHADVDYFPSYELISSAASEGRWFEPNMRNVRMDGVAFVMKHFFAGVGAIPAPVTESQPATSALHFDPSNAEDQALAAVCEDEVLERFND